MKGKTQGHVYAANRRYGRERIPDRWTTQCSHCRDRAQPIAIFFPDKTTIDCNALFFLRK